MKKVFILLAAVLFIAAGTAAFGAISTTPHNLTNTANPVYTSSSTATLCGFCHIPHGGNTAVAGLPLWARQGQAASFYSVYGGGTTLAGTTVNAPGANSLTCLTCHDGTVGVGITYKNGVAATPYTMTTNTGGHITSNGALDWAGYNSDTTLSGYNPVIGGSAGNDLTNDHPVGVVYTVGSAGLGAAPSWAKLYSSRVECASCHDPHDMTNDPFLRAPAATICQGCHSTK